MRSPITSFPCTIDSFRIPERTSITSGSRRRRAGSLTQVVQGQVAKRDVGPFWRADYKVYVGGRSRTTLATATEFQREAVLAALRSNPEAKEATFTPRCAFRSKSRLLDFPFQVGAVGCCIRER